MEMHDEQRSKKVIMIDGTDTSVKKCLSSADESEMRRIRKIGAPDLRQYDFRQLLAKVQGVYWRIST
jgi:hypothetical protein